MIAFGKPKPLSTIQEERERANLTPELLVVLEAVAALDQQCVELQATVQQQGQAIAALRAEIESLKGGGQ
ncbi:hypothetical protein [Brevibacillus thermoruber]|uniref:hypothetical protein n=1 Tax=Brevibacillus thermoruber TaxID=33942 RepID=UPI0005554B4B|nr:hypothetical protein [Brevibacillus thermoruber]